ncbi:MAG TPA: two-component regulator propeller domain-containing protein [Bacteroidia bacterium]|nr:two-component regulator propeller domain-containing protein [Bacteroidia bacterium]
MKKIIYLLGIFVLCFCNDAASQNALKSFQWRDHLPYNKAFSVTNQGNTIYAVSDECIFSFDKDDNAYQRLNKVTGLSDIEPTVVKNNPYNNTLMVLYKNSNIDVIKSGGVTNVADLFRKQNFGNKTINSVTFSKNLAYLACGFGIAVFDTDALQFQDTYIIGPGGGKLNVYQVALSSSTIFAATSNGIYYAPLNSPNLASYTYWQQVTSLPNPNDVYNGIVYFGGNIIASYSWNLTQGNNAGSASKDTLYKFDGSTWSKNPFGTIDGVIKLSVSDNKKQLIVVDNIGFVAYDSLAHANPKQWGFPGLGSAAYFTTDAIADPKEPGWFWETNSLYGLIKLNTDTVKPQQFSLNGPSTDGCAQIQIKDDKVIVASSFLGYKHANSYLENGVYVFQNNAWSADANAPRNQIIDINCVAFDNNDKNHYYAGSFGNGLIEIQNDSVVAKYDCSNSPISPRNFPTNTQVQVAGLYSDINNNLWVVTNDNPTFVTVKKNDGHWANLDFTSLVPDLHYQNVTQVIVDSNNFAWISTFGAGLYVYKNDGTFSQPNASNSKRLINLAGKGGLPSIYIICLAQDKNNDIWVGTDQGIYVYYNPESIFTQSTGWDAQPIYVQQDGITQLLLQTDNVSTIFVDGANNKWVGTSSSGLFYFSPDGQTQLFHFTTDNSPLFSNNIISVNVNPKTGEVFIATDKGIQSFQNITTEGLTSFEDVYAYPNPVKPGYTGPILIHGMISGASVKLLMREVILFLKQLRKEGKLFGTGKTLKGSV